MWISVVTLIITVVFLERTESALVGSANQCVPTTMVRGPCHVCVCSHEGVFNCRPLKCQKVYMGENRPQADCEPNYVFRQDTLFCRCSKLGFWQSDNCEATFSYLYPITYIDEPDEMLRTKIACSAKKFYLIDCNICRCSNSNVIDVKLCTSRNCAQGNKADACANGDIIRFGSQLCSCTDMYYYTDRLCIDILDEVVQTLKPEDISKLEDIGRTWTSLSSLKSNACDSTFKYTIDCTTCNCVDSHLLCTNNTCKGKTERAKEIDTLPELESDVVSCEPGKMYRYKCNACTCTKDGFPSCTTMVCLENQVDLDLTALKGVLSSGLNSF